MRASVVREETLPKKPFAIFAAGVLCRIYRGPDLVLVGFVSVRSAILMCLIIFIFYLQRLQRDKIKIYDFIKWLKTTRAKNMLSYS